MEKTRKPGVGLQATDGDALSGKRARAMGWRAGQSVGPGVPQQHDRATHPGAPILLTDFLFFGGCLTHTTDSLYLFIFFTTDNL